MELISSNNFSAKNQMDKNKKEYWNLEKNNQKYQKQLIGFAWVMVKSYQSKIRQCIVWKSLLLKPNSPFYNERRK